MTKFVLIEFVDGFYDWIIVHYLKKHDDYYYSKYFSGSYI